MFLSSFLRLRPKVVAWRMAIPLRVHALHSGESAGCKDCHGGECIPINLVGRREIECHQTTDLYLLEIGMDQDAVSVEAQNSGPGEINKVISLIASHFGLNQMCVPGGDGED